MKSLRELLKEGTSYLQKASIENPRKEARLLLQYALGMDSGAFLTHMYRDDELVPSQSFLSWLKRRAAHEPFAYITGHKEFWSLDFKVSNKTLIPRPETEIVIEVLLALRPQKQQNYVVLDIGTGSGCLLISTLHEYRRARGIGVDFDVQTAKIAEGNLKHHHMTERGSIICSHWLDGINDDCQFDIILSNPPYIPHQDILTLESDVKDYEPILALDGGEDGLDAYRALFAILPRRLKQGGVGIFEFGIGQSSAICELAQEKGLAILGVWKDLGGIDRVIAVQRSVG